MKQKELTSAPYYRSDHQGKMTCNLPASLLDIDMMAYGPGKSARDFGATRAFFVVGFEPATVDSRELYATTERRVVKVDIYIQRQLTT